MSGLADILLPAGERHRLRRIGFVDAGSGYDAFGLRPEAVALSAGLLRILYKHYFRVRSQGAEHIPARGAAILAANHGGVLPFDAAMLYLDVLLHTDPPRVPRAIADLFVAQLPFVGTLFARSGVTGGSRGNVHQLLEQGELLMLFPEGTRGIGKAAGERHQLTEWRVGHAELALRHRAPVVPAAIVGPDDQWPMLARLDHLHPLGAPFLPLPLLPFPLPVRYHIRYGEPIALHEQFSPARADDPSVIAAAAAVVKQAVGRLLAEGVRARPGVFA